MRYYKDDVYKGEINLRRVASIEKRSGGLLSGMSSHDTRILQLVTPTRVWIFQADNADDCIRWYSIIRAYDMYLKTNPASSAAFAAVNNNQEDSNLDEEDEEED